jgi:transposase-like protein
LGFEVEELQGQPLEFFAREGARMLLQVALEEEVSAFLGRGAYERDGQPDGYRNGTRQRTVHCGSGEISVELPKVVGSSRPFRRQVLTAWQRRSEALVDVIPGLYVEGLSTRDFKRALQPLWGAAGLAKSSISRATQALKTQFTQWRQRDLSQEAIAYLFLDGYYLGVRGNSRTKDAVLVAHGIRQDKSRVPLAIHLGGKESAASWKAVLHDLEQRGLSAPALIITDGNPGLLRALKDVWPDVPQQRCTKHRTANVLARIPKKRQAEVKAALQRIFHAASLDDALTAAQHFHTRYQDEFPTAVAVLAERLADCLTFYRFPEVHWKRIRTSNVLERAFKEVRRRTNVVGRFPTEQAALNMIFGVLTEDRVKWRSVPMRPHILELIVAAVQECQTDPLTIEWADRLAA